MTTQVRWVVAFQIEQQTYALPVEQVARIIDIVTLTPLPGVEQAVVGAINVQGHIVPVVDLRRHFHQPIIAWKRHTPIVLVDTSAQTIGLIVDAVTDVLKLSPDQIQRVADVLPVNWPDVPLIQGLARTATGNLWLLLDLDHLFQLDQVQAMLAACDRLWRDQTEAVIPQVEVS